MRALPVLLAVLALPVAWASPALVLGPVGRLPEPGLGAPAVWTGAEVLRFGGAEMVCYCERDLVVRFDPQDASVEALDERLPRPAAWAAAAWDGARAYVVTEDDVWRYDPATGAFEAFPLGRHAFQPAAAFLDGALYVFDFRSKVLRFDPASGAVEETGTVLPLAFAHGAVATDGTVVYGFGGLGDAFGLGAGLAAGDEVWRYDPATDTLGVLDARLPVGRVRAAAAWDGGAFLVVGGFTPLVVAPPLVHADVLRFDPATGIWDVAAVLPHDVYDATVVATGTETYVLGGGCVCPEGEPPPGDVDALVFWASVESMQTDEIYRIG